VPIKKSSYADKTTMEEGQSLLSGLFQKKKETALRAQANNVTSAE
jgi:hypothetical protein